MVNYLGVLYVEPVEISHVFLSIELDVLYTFNLVVTFSTRLALYWTYLAEYQ